MGEEALHEAFAAAVEQWPREGVPKSPRAWLVSAGRFRAIDALRRRSRYDASLAELARRLEGASVEAPGDDHHELEDDRLRLVFTCCHPALRPEAQVALTLRQVCGLTTEEIARAFLTTAPTVAQRIVRAKAKIRDARIPYQVPSRRELPERLDAVLKVVYLVFNEGYAASSGETLLRCDVSGEAIRLGRLLVDLLIAAVHAEAPSAGETDWVEIVGLYDVLPQADPSPVVELNRAAVVAMRDGPAAGLPLVDAILARGELADHHLAHAARADLWPSGRRGRPAENWPVQPGFLIVSAP